MQSKNRVSKKGFTKPIKRQTHSVAKSMTLVHQAGTQNKPQSKPPSKPQTNSHSPSKPHSPAKPHSPPKSQSPPNPQTVPQSPPKPQTVPPPSKLQAVVIPSQTNPTSSVVGTKRALLIGINYIKNPSVGLNGCINDVKNIRNLLMQSFDYKQENIILMSDDQSGNMEPTKNNIMSQIIKIVSTMSTNDVLFIHYSGHGTQVKSLDNDETNNPDTPGQDDCICPCDFGNYPGDTGFIIDDTLKEILVNKIPTGAKLRAFFDCCHSGSALDLEYMWKNNQEYTQISSPEKQSDDIVLISGCKDNQTSTDSWNAQKKQAMGALTMALMKALTNTPKIKTSWKDLILLARHYLATDGYDQIPMLSVSNKLVGDLMIDI